VTNFICGLGAGGLLACAVFLTVDGWQWWLAWRQYHKSLRGERAMRRLFSEIGKQNAKRRFDFSHN
jgi:hypothetical protein